MRFRFLPLAGVLVAGMSCSAPNAEPGETVQSGRPARPLRPIDRVLLVVNSESPESVEIGKYYQQRRNLSAANVVTIKVSTGDTISPSAYKLQIETPLKKALDARKQIDFMVLTKGIPIRLLDEGGYSVDAMLASMNLKQEPIKQKIGAFGLDEPDVEAAIERVRSPYFMSKEPFSRKKFGMVLVTRLTGYTVADAKKLVDQSLKAKASQAPILLDSQPQFAPGSGYAEMEDCMARAFSMLDAKGVKVELDDREAFALGPGALLGYASWGSNDPKFDLKTYRRLTFVPGALAETFVSTSGRTFSPVESGQSLIADLIAQGVTGAKGYVSEPFTFALCRVEVLFDRYLSGMNLAESFYSASPLIKWKDIVIGDPLCQPFPRK